jgi:hypothetical protein
MRRILRRIYFFMPVQLVLLHLRKYRLLLVFWLILYFTITGNLAAHFGASTLFLAPEYLGRINFTSMFLLGGALCVFMMTWHITTFIVHSKRMPYMGATRQAFIVYCINNSVIPVIFLLFYEFISVRFLKAEEADNLSHILLLELGFLLGLTFVTFLSFAYFFSVSRDSLKVAISRITNPVRIRDIVPYDSLDYEIDIIPARWFISGKLRIERSTDLEPYHPRVMTAVLRRHHRNVIFGTFMCFIVLIVLGTFKEQPLLRVPAGCGFLLLFSIMMSLVAALRYFLKSWETIGWILLLLSVSALVHYKLFDMRSYAYGINYRGQKELVPDYSYPELKKVFTPKLYWQDLGKEEQRLTRWKSKITDESGKPPLVIITVSGGGSRSAYWSFRTLQYIDSVTHGALFRHTVMITGASGGMIGATYWRNLHAAAAKNKAIVPYGPALQENVGKDLLNSIIFSMASVDVISPLSKVVVGDYEYPRGRGYAFEQEMIRNTDGILAGSVGYWSVDEQAGESPRMFIAGTIVNDGRKLLINGTPASFLSQPCYSLNDTNPQIDAVDFATFFSAQDASQLRIATALRMNATFPFILPVVKLPSSPMMNIMDAGLRDNFGSEIASRYLFALRRWMSENAGKIIQLDIRDTRENYVGSPFEQNSLMGMLADPLFAIQNKWEAFQSFNHSYVKDLSPACLSGKLSYITLRYMPREPGKNAELNFHLTQKEKTDIYKSIENPENTLAAKAISRTLMEFYEAN